MTHFTRGQHIASINPIKGFKVHLLVFLLTIPATWLVWYLTGTANLWPLWHSLSWTAGLLFHYLGVFVFQKSANN